ncbi:MAG: hypothetical protein D6761_13650 [Candidatus Dadabacteria bacterium]|nr:MAG: hypothetical protein D6761_13650 [Candidatus Dadabacteria bacterium]
MPREQFIIIGFFLILCVRLLTGPAVDLVVAGSGAILLAVTRRSPAGARAWALLAGLALLQSVLPAFSRAAALTPAGWYAPGSALDRWSVAPWASLRWGALFAGAACWTVLLGGGRRWRRDVGRMIRGLGLFVAASVIVERLSGRSIIAGGENHIATFLAMTAAEPLRRLRGSEVMPWLSLLLIGAAMGLVGAMLPLVLLTLLVLWSLRSSERPAGEFTWRGMSVFVGVAALASVGVASISGRLPVWRDAAVMLWETWPWGTGFGSFRWAFPAWAVHLPAPAGRALHPESTLLWWVVEAGLPGLLLLVAFRARATTGRAGQASRWALALFALESLIEVPLLWGPCLWLVVACYATGFDLSPREQR